MLRLVHENPRWGDQRIVGELNGLGIVVSAITVKRSSRYDPEKVFHPDYNIDPN